jgi:hypothetical protein
MATQPTDAPIRLEPWKEGDGVAPPKGPPRTTAEVLDLVSYVMDRCMTIPGTRMRVGLNSLLMLLPIAGDLLANLVSAGILVVGLTSYRVPRIVATRMVLNTALDTSIGWIPVVGDLFDMFFKADTRNVRLLQAYLGQNGQPPPSTWRHWAFVLGLLGALVLVLVLVVAGTIAVMQLLWPGRQ